MNTLNNYIVVKKISEEIKSKSGLTISDSDMTDMRYYKGVVMLDNEDYDKVKKGDTLYYDKAQGNPFRLNGESCTIIRTVDIVMVEK